MKNNKTKTLITTLVLSGAILLTSCASTTTTTSTSAPSLPVKHGDDKYTDNIFKISQLAESAYQESRWTDAARYYQQLTESVPSDAYVWFKLANTYVQKGEFNQAIHAYETSIARDSVQPKPWFNLSTTYLLNAKAALLQSWENLRSDDPARGMIMQRIESIDALMNQEMGRIRVSQ